MSWTCVICIPHESEERDYVPSCHPSLFSLGTRQYVGLAGLSASAFQHKAFCFSANYLSGKGKWGLCACDSYSVIQEPEAKESVTSNINIAGKEIVPCICVQQMSPRITSLKLCVCIKEFGTVLVLLLTRLTFPTCCGTRLCRTKLYRDCVFVRRATFCLVWMLSDGSATAGRPVACFKALYPTRSAHLSAATPLRVDGDSQVCGTATLGNSPGTAGSGNNHSATDICMLKN